MRDSPRFLITTADERSWRIDQPVLFLGEWCRLHDRRSRWEVLDAQVVEPYGLDPVRQEADYALVQHAFEVLLIEVSKALNCFHGTNYSVRYWRILLGLWLYRFTSIVFNRWSTIQHALARYCIVNTTVLDFPKDDLVANDSGSFIYSYIRDEWNHAIYGRILSDHREVCIEKIRAEFTGGCAQTSPVFPGAIRQRVKSMGLQGMRMLAKLVSRPTDACLISTYLPAKYEFLLQLTLKQVPQFWHLPCAPITAPNWQLRQRFVISTSGYEGFDRCVRMLIPEHIPTCYLEGYRSLVKLVEQVPLPKRPKVIFTANRFDTDEVFKAWTASKVELGIPYVISQHGGNYGTARFVPTETHETKTADRYLTWGWTDGSPKHYPSAALRLVGRRPRRWSPAGSLLLVTVHADLPDTPWDHVTGFAQQLEQQFAFVRSLPRDIQSRMIVRLHSFYRYLPWSEEQRWRERGEGVQLNCGDTSIRSLIDNSRLIVHSYNSTGILESLAMNIPTLCMWDTRHWRLRPNAVPYFDRLKQVGIFHEDAESAVDRVKKVWGDVMSWWSMPEVQQARCYFCERFARVPPSPIKVLKEALTTVISQ